MTPELRSAVFSFPLYQESISSPSNWLPSGGKHEILSALQELFVKLAYLDERAISTENLTKSFGWTGVEVVVQHDAQELSRVFFDCLERALIGTEFSDLIRNVCKGKFLNLIICSQCGNKSAREEDFSDIGLMVKGCQNVLESLDQLTKDDVLDGNNQYFCGVCNGKVDAVRLTKIHKLPSLLTFSLNRFEYDMSTFERVKISQNFEFGLEIDMGKYVENAGVYELFAVIIHGGSAYSGHYHAYIRDILKQGNWAPSAAPAKEEKSEKEEKVEPKPKPQAKQSKKNRKNRKKAKNRAQTQAKKQPEPDFFSYEFEDFSEVCTNKNLLENWFDFNDSTVTAIKSGKLRKQFGGSNESAYILIYRLASPIETPIPEMPEYWKSAITSLNEDYKKHREQYENLKEVIELQLQVADLFEFSDGLVVYKDLENPAIKQGMSVRMNLTDTIEDLKNNIACAFIDEIPELFQTHQVIISIPLSNKCAHLMKPLDSIENEISLKDAKIWHKACLLILPRNEEIIEKALDFIGEICEPISINCNYEGDKFNLFANKAWTLLKVKEKISKKLNIPLEKISLKICKFEGGEKKLREKDEDSTLIDLKFYHSISLSILSKEEAIPMVELLKNDQGEGLTSVLLNDENKIDQPVQYLVNSQWKIRDLLVECRKLFEIPEEVPVRLRKLVDRKVIVKEDVDMNLRSIPEFIDGGFRFQVERGEPPAYGHIVIKVSLDCNGDYKEIFVKETERISEVKARAGEVLGFLPDQYKLYRTDWLKEPISALKQENYTLFKAAVKDGDLLLARTSDTVLDTEMLKLHIYVSPGGLPMDIQFISEISVSEDTTLKKLKEILNDTQGANEEKKGVLRVRELMKTLWPGKVYKDDHKSLKKLSISFGANLLIEWVDCDEVTSYTGAHIYIAIRNLAEKKIQDIIPCYFDGGATPNIDHLYQFVLRILKKDWELSDITLAKFKSQNFEWEIIKDPRQAEEKGNLLNVRPSNTSQGIYNLKKQPYLIKDGDLIAVRYDKEEGATEDNFVCMTDAANREEYLKRKIASKKPGKGKREARPEKSIRIGDF